MGRLTALRQFVAAILGILFALPAILAAWLALQTLAKDVVHGHSRVLPRHPTTSRVLGIPPGVEPLNMEAFWREKV